MDIIIIISILMIIFLHSISEPTKTICLEPVEIMPVP